MKKIVLSVLLFTGLGFIIYDQVTHVCEPTDLYVQERKKAKKLQMKLNDFARIRRFHGANKKLSSPVKEEKRIVFLGDSITQGWELDKYFPDQPYINRGIGGQTTPQMLIRMRPDVIELKPTAVILLAGVNDVFKEIHDELSLDFIQGNIASIAELARQNEIRVVLASVLPINNLSYRKDDQPLDPDFLKLSNKIKELNNWIKNYCRKEDMIYLDYFSAMSDERGFLRSELSNDGLHPNAKGYQIMQPLAEEAIKKVLSK
jgi:lysophospholipase L1-like esterase